MLLRIPRHYRRLGLLAGSGVATIIFLSSPASANIFGALEGVVNSAGSYLKSFGPLLERTGLPISEINGSLSEASTYVQSLSGFYRSVSSENLQNIVGGTEDVAGVLGYPDLFRLRTTYQKRLELAPNTSPIVRASSIEELSTLNRLGVEAIADTVLSQDGQALMMMQLEIGASAAEAAAEAAAASQQAGDSQEVLKAMAAQQAAIAAIDLQVLTTLEMVSVQTAAGNTLLVDVSESLDRANSNALYDRLGGLQGSLLNSTKLFVPYMDDALAGN